MAETASPAVTWTKAKLEMLEPKEDGNGSVIDSIEFPFNPKDWAITYGAEWKAGEGNKKAVSRPQWKGPKPASVTIEMFLDASMADNGDISTTIAKLRKLVDNHGPASQQNKPSSPHVRFQWGQAVMFQGYCEQIAVKYALFRENGAPIRGSATLTLKEFPRAPAGQNPTSGSLTSPKSHKVVAGDTLASIAYKEYGAPGNWRDLANANPFIDDPMRLRPGSTLLVPQI